MKIEDIKTYGQSKNKAFETLVVQLFKSYVNSIPNEQIISYIPVNDAGGDGGVEAYAEAVDGSIYGVQAKWFLDPLKKAQITNIEKSLGQALNLRPTIKKYIVAIPRDSRSKTYRRSKEGSSKQETKNNEDELIADFISTKQKQYPGLSVIFWKENELLEELQKSSNADLIKFWFEKEIISIDQLKKSFEKAKASWLRLKYVPKLHVTSPVDEISASLDHNADFVGSWFKKTNHVTEILRVTIESIDKFLETISSEQYFSRRLLVIRRNLESYMKKYDSLYGYLKNDEAIESKLEFKEVNFSRTLLSIDAFRPSNIQKNAVESLRLFLREVHQINIEQYFQNIQDDLFVNSVFIKGPPGTGKTHNLARFVDDCLNIGHPALIINSAQQLGESWKCILETSIDVYGWTEGEIFSGLCSLAYLSERTQNEKSCFICVDALDEINSFEQRNNWVHRINELKAILPNYPALKIILASRPSFYRFSEIDERKSLKIVEWSEEGEIDLEQLKSFYFQEFNIQNVPFSVSSQFRTPLELRLFCEEYQGHEIFSNDLNITIKRLLKLKTNRIGHEFVIKMSDELAAEQMFNIIEEIALYFAGLGNEVEINALHDISEHLLNKGIDSKTGSIALDLLSEHGILIREFHQRENVLGFEAIQVKYFPSYRSFYEVYLTDKISNDIAQGDVNTFYRIFENNFREPLSTYSRKLVLRERYLSSSPLRICMTIVKNLFTEFGLLIGTKSFNPDKLDLDFLFELRCYALSVSSPDKIAPYEQELTDAFLSGGLKQKIVFDFIIDNDSLGDYGPQFLDNLLKPLSCFARDKIWSGKDAHERSNQDHAAYLEGPLENIGLTFHVSVDSAFNRKPLILAWGLSSINNKLRRALKQTLFLWALKSIEEFKKLLLHFKDCNDPQINEDLSGVFAAVGSELEDREEIRSLALWVHGNLLNEMEKYSSAVAIRGFTSLIERAINLDIASQKDFPNIFHRQRQDPNTTIIKRLPFDEIERDLNADGFYPIKHDLYWYVFSNYWSYFEPDYGGLQEDWDELLSAYKKIHENIDLQSLVLALAIHRIRELGFDRKSILGFVSDDRSSLPEQMNYEHKYVWLSLNYLNYYLAKYIRVNRKESQSRLEVDFSNVVELETLKLPLDIRAIADKYSDNSRSILGTSNWIIPGILTPEVKLKRDDPKFKKALKNLILKEQGFDFPSWIIMKLEGIEDEVVTLYSENQLHDSHELLYTDLELTCCFIAAKDFENFSHYLSEHDIQNEHFKEQGRIISLKGTPSIKSSVALNEISWKGINSEYSKSFKVYSPQKVFELFPARIEIVKTENGSDQFYLLPSAISRKIFSIAKEVDNVFLDSNQSEILFRHKKSDRNRDKQRGLFMKKSEFVKCMSNSEWKPIWIAEYLRRVNVHDRDISQLGLPQKSRKYFTWRDDRGWGTKKIWEGHFSNSEGFNIKSK